MAPPLRSKMERAFASDFSAVRIHQGPQAAAIGATAFTAGSHIHFAPGRYQPHTELGQATIGHELAHVVQQSSGMARSTREVGGVRVDDSPRLERQADVAGARAALGQPTGSITGSRSASTNASPVVQREIEGNDLKEVLAWQKRLQTAAKANPGAHKYMYTTVGFEHEFGQMDDGPLHGVDHLELAKSTAPDLPYTDLPFVLETDAANSVELVSPPFLLPTKSSGKFTAKSKRKPVPIADDVRAIDGMFRTVLATAVNYKRARILNPRRGAMDNFTYTNKTMAEVAASIDQNSGIKFPFLGATVEPFQLSPATTGKFDDDSANVSKPTLEGIHVTPSTKGSHDNQPHIITQVNFATDAATADSLQRESDTDPTLRPVATPSIVKVFRDVEAAVRAVLVPGPPPATELRIFYDALARSLSGQIAVPYLAYFKQAQEDAFDWKLGMTDLDDFSKEALSLAESISSHVKDTSGVWVKDMVVNLGLGLLTRAQWLIVRARVADVGVIDGIKKATAVDVSDKWPANLRWDTRDAIGKASVAALARVVEIIDKDVKPGTAGGFDARVAGLHLGQQDGEKRLEFGQHRARDVGPRQDTYIKSNKVQTPLWGSRLHVVETRGDSLEKQLELIKKVGG